MKSKIDKDIARPGLCGLLALLGDHTFFLQHLQDIVAAKPADIVARNNQTLAFYAVINPPLM